MLIKLSNYPLNDYYWEQDGNKIVPGIHVCPSNGCTKIGTIIEVGPLEQAESWVEYDVPAWVKVRWATGSKKGKIEQKDCDTLINADRYVAAINEEHTRITNLVEEAKALD